MPNHQKKNRAQQLLKFFGMGASALFFANTARRYSDTVNGQDDFSQHTRKQHHQHLFSGMHEPLVPNAKQRSIFEKFFPQFSHLLVSTLNQFKQEQAIKTPVRFRPLSECPVVSDYQNADPLVVGGFPALMSAVSWVQKGRRVTYINDERRRPIAYGSAWHLEQDAETEAPTTYQPIQFFTQQVIRATLQSVKHAEIENTGFFPWRTLDWVGWLQHPEQWWTGLKLGAAFQAATTAPPEQRALLMQKVAEQCKTNEQFFEELNKKLNGALLMAGRGSLIVARNPEEIADLTAMKKSLEQEGRTLAILSKEEAIQRYGFAPQGLMYAEKTHDRVLTPHFMKLLTRFIREEGGQTINGTLTTVYTDGQHPGGIAEYRTPDGLRNLIPFSQLVLSLGNQPVLDTQDKPLFDVVAARGVSVLAHVYAPKGTALPPAIVCGGTNHVTKLSENPASLQAENGKTYDLYLVRMTAGACITPNVSEEDAANYDGTIAVGLIQAARKTFGDQFIIEPISIYGCNRQVSQYGQTQWISPYPGVNVQYGAGGGGLTRGPDFAVNHSQQDSAPTYKI